MYMYIGNILQYVQYVQYVPSTWYIVPNIPNIHNILTNIGHRFGHQSGLYESSGQNSAAILIAYSFRVYFVFSNICKITQST